MRVSGAPVGEVNFIRKGSGPRNLFVTPSQESKISICTLGVNGEKFTMLSGILILRVGSDVADSFSSLLSSSCFSEILSVLSRLLSVLICESNLLSVVVAPAES